jgi:hypothetical protein
VHHCLDVTGGHVEEVRLGHGINMRIGPVFVTLSLPNPGRSLAEANQVTTVWVGGAICDALRNGRCLTDGRLVKRDECFSLKYTAQDVSVAFLCR